MQITNETFREPITLTARVAARDNKKYFWEVIVAGMPGANPTGGGCTIMVKRVAKQSGECDSAHEAEFRAAAALVEMAAQQRLFFAAAEAELITRNNANESAKVATERLALIGS